MRDTDRRAFIDAVAALPSKHRAWLASDDIELFAFYGWGIVLNDAQLEAIHAFRLRGAGTVHLWRWANRTGKTTACIVLHLWAIWKKWRYVSEELDDWLDFTYRTLHSAPLNRLTGKAWELAEGLIAGSTWQQRDPVRARQRPALLAPFFKARSGRTSDGSDMLWVESGNGGQIDFLSTHDGAGRMESEAWWLLSWDEFVRQQPVEDVPLLFDQTFLPRSSDFMAPIILSSTVTEDAEPIYQELEDVAADHRNDWNIMTFDRSANFAQSRESIDRQKRLSLDPAIAARSVGGGIGEGGRGTLFPHILLQTAFDPDLPTDYSDAELAGFRARGHEFITIFDHAIRGDLNVATTLAVPWPVPQGDDAIGSFIGVGLDERRSGTHLTPTLQTQFALDVVDRYESRFLIVDATGEGGEIVYRSLREELPGRVVGMVYNAKRVGALSKNKELGLQALQRQMAWGLDVAASEHGWVDEFPPARKGSFGLYRLPFTGRWLKLHREMAVLRRDDQKQRQDRAMTLVMAAWYLDTFVASVRSAPQPFSIVGRRNPRRRRVAVAMR